MPEMPRVPNSNSAWKYFSFIGPYQRVNDAANVREKILTFSLQYFSGEVAKRCPVREVS